MSSRIEELAEKIVYHQDRYYNDQPEITDREFDALWDELKELAPDHPIFSRVGEDYSSVFPKREHRIPMNSQEKAATPEQFLRWARRVGHSRYIVQYKLDGASIELQYEAGSFTHGVTRGDGRVGDDITANVLRMQGVPRTVPDRFTGAVRGEIIMEHSVLRQHYADKANCRNAANGIMRRKDGVGSELLRIMVYDALSLQEESRFHEEEQKLRWLRASGFDLVPSEVFDTTDEIIHYRDLVNERRSSLDYDIDGLVVKGPLVDLQDMRRARPQKQIAFKFSAEEEITVLRDVEWSESGHLYTPVAIVDPVHLAGTTVRRASLVHPELIASMRLRIGSEVVITKRGDIIPKIERLVRHLETTYPIRPPERCATCGTEVINEGKRVYCPNPSCPRRDFHRLQKWISVLDVRDFGDVLLRKLFDSGRLNTIPDFYRLRIEDLSEFEGMGPVSARKALENLRAANPIPLEKFIAGFDIGGIAELKVRKVVDAGFDTFERIAGASVEDLSAVEGIATVTAEALLEGIKAVSGQMRELLDSDSVEVVQGDSRSRDIAPSLKGLSFCFTGTLETMKRSDAEKIVRTAGGEVRSSVTRELSRLVTNDPNSGSSKAKKARELSVPIITEEEFFAMVGQETINAVASRSQP